MSDITIHQITAREVFTLVDDGDAAGFSHLFSDSGRMVFANGEPMVGPQQVEAGVRGFFTTIGGMHHEIEREWTNGPDTTLRLAVIYTRLDGRNVTIPVVTLWHLDDAGRFDDYRVYFDLAPVFAP